MKKITLKDYIDLERMVSEGKSEIEQQAFFLSRYFNLPISEVLELDHKVVCMMREELAEYLNDDIRDYETMEKEMKRIKRKSKDKPQSRFDMMDL